MKGRISLRGTTLQTKGTSGQFMWHGKKPASKISIPGRNAKDTCEKRKKGERGGIEGGGGKGRASSSFRGGRKKTIRLGQQVHFRAFLTNG